jgi:tetratricopeptide (TPR) repeat protein
MRKTLDAGRQQQKEKYDYELPSGMVRYLNELGMLRMAQGCDKEAEELFEQGIDLGTELPGKDHPHKLRCVNGLAIIYIRQQRYEEAKTLLERVLAGRKLKLGEDHPETIKTINDLGILYREQKNYEQAEKFLTEAYDRRQAILGPEHPHTLESIHELGILYKEQSLYDEAEKLLLEAVNGRRLKLGDSSHQMSEADTTASVKALPLSNRGRILRLWLRRQTVISAVFYLCPDQRPPAFCVRCLLVTRLSRRDTRQSAELPCRWRLFDSPRR